MNVWMTCSSTSIYSISVIPGRCEGDNERLCAMESRLQLERFPKQVSNPGLLDRHAST